MSDDKNADPFNNIDVNECDLNNAFITLIKQELQPGALSVFITYLLWKQTIGLYTWAS